MTKPTCKNCKKNYKILTKEGYCAFCHYSIVKEWPSNFRGPGTGGRR